MRQRGPHPRSDEGLGVSAHVPRPWPASKRHGGLAPREAYRLVPPTSRGGEVHESRRPSEGRGGERAPVAV